MGRHVTTYKVHYRAIGNFPEMNLTRNEEGVHANRCASMADAQEKAEVCRKFFNSNKKLEPASLSGSVPIVHDLPPTERVVIWINEYRDGELVKDNAPPLTEEQVPCDENESLRQEIADLKKKNEELNALMELETVEA